MAELLFDNINNNGSLYDVRDNNLCRCELEVHCAQTQVQVCVDARCIKASSFLNHFDFTLKIADCRGVMRC